MAGGTAIVTSARPESPVPTGQASAAIRLAGATTFGAAEAIADPDVAGPPAPAFDPIRPIHRADPDAADTTVRTTDRSLATLLVSTRMRART